MDSSTLLRRHGRISTSNYDFITNFGRKAKYCVAQSNFAPFMKDYCVSLRDHINNYEDNDDPNSRAIFDISQKPTKTPPIVVDLSLKYSQEPNEAYNDYFIMLIVKALQSAIFDIYQVEDDEDSNHLLCIVCDWDNSIQVRDERPGHPPNSLNKIRFYFPFCRAPSETIPKIIPRASTYLRTLNAFSALEHSPIGDWDHIIKPWVNEAIPLYGSSEMKEYPMLKLKYAFLNLLNIELDQSEIEEVTCDIDSVFEDRHSFELAGIFSSNFFEGLSITDLLPLYLTNNYDPTIKQIREIDNTPNVHNSDDIPREFGQSTRQNDKTNIDIILDLLPIISKERYYKKNSWIEIGKALNHATNGSEEGLQIWIQRSEEVIESSKRYPEFVGDRLISDIAQEEYYSFNNTSYITHRTIAWYAQEDNIERYKNWHANWCLASRESALSRTNYAVASALYCDLWLNYACVNPEKKILYHFKNHRWYKLTGGSGIRLYMSNQFKRVFEEIRARLTRQIADSHDANYKADAERINQKLSSLIIQLDDRTFKNKVLGEVLDMLHVDMDRFEDIIDTNGNLTGLPNGVVEVDYDAKTILFRQGKPEDYLTRSTLARFIDMGWDHPLVKELMSWLSKMFVDEKTRHFVLKLLGSGFISGNLDKLAPIFTGNMNNSKSALVRALMYTWGSYSVKFPTTGITRGYSDSGAPNPAWARLDKVRWAFADEPDERECFRSGPFKIIFGNDAIYNRKLFSDGSDVEASATVVTSCNRVPPFPNADAASIERLCLVPCLSTWVKPDKVPETVDEQYEKRLFPMDKNFINRVRLLCPAILWVSYQYFPIWALETLDNRPPEVERATSQYWKENDIYLMYTADRIEEAPSTNGLTIIEIYDDFELWFNKYNKNFKLPDRATVREHLIGRWQQTPEENIWWGIKLKEIVKPNEETTTRKNQKNTKTPAILNESLDSLEVTDLGFPVLKERKRTDKKIKIIVRNGKLVTNREEANINLTTV